MLNGAQKYELGYEWVKRGAERKKKTTLGLVLNEIKAGSEVLEVGTAGGYMTLCRFKHMWE